jgi:uncharacterized membrane protein YidH (DUF202 family)
LSTVEDSKSVHPSRSRRRAAIEAAILALAVALVIAHTAYWRANGRQVDLYEDRGALSVLYNLALVLGTGALVGMLLMRVTEAMGYHVTEIEHFAGDDGDLDEARTL